MNELVTNLLALLETKFTTTFKSYEYGKVEVPMTRDLPLISVNPVSTEVLNSGTVKDENNFTVEVVVMASVKQYLNNVSDSPSIRSALQALVEWVEDRDSTGAVKATSIIGVIRQNTTASNVVLFNNEITVSYTDYLDADEMPTVKATITFKAQSRTTRL